MNIVCKECGDTFTARPSGPTATYCSARCRKRVSRRNAQARTSQPATSLPEVMASARRWTRADGKRPIMVDGAPASSTWPSTWTSYSAVQAGAGDGYGIMLGEGLGCWDLDNALDDGRLKPWARDILDRLREPVIFTEVSVSGQGLHVFVKAPERSGSRRQVADGSVEFYSRARFIRVTGVEFQEVK